MAIIAPYNYKVITNGSPDVSWGSIDIRANVDYYYIDVNTVSLTDNWALSPVGTPSEGTVVRFYYKGGVTNLGPYLITIFDYNLTAYQASKANILECVYINGVWKVFLIEDYTIENRGIEGTFITDISAGTGDSIMFDSSTMPSYQIITGSNLLTGTYTVRGTTTEDGAQFIVRYEATMTGGNPGDINIFGRELTAEQQESGDLTVIATYSTQDSAWHTILITESQVDGGGGGEGHTQNTDQYLDYGGSFQLTVQEIYNHIYAITTRQTVDVTDLTTLNISAYPAKNVFLLTSSNSLETINKLIDTNATLNKRIFISANTGKTITFSEDGTGTSVILNDRVDFTMSNVLHYTEFIYNGSYWVQGSSIGVRNIVMIGTNWRLRNNGTQLMTEILVGGNWITMNQIS